MKRSSSPERLVLAGDSARMQGELHRRGLSPPKDRVAPEVLLQRRLEAGRNPLSGITEAIPELKTPNPEDLVDDKGNAGAEILLSAQRINARILEAWINNTIIDAEHLEIPGALAKSEQQHPLSRYGVDRHSLAGAGVSNSDIDRLYKALFVYSLGFYQLINKTLEHVVGKYTYVAGLWKVYAILLEYCCKVDYNMAIATVQEEKRTALEKLETHYRKQVHDLQGKCDGALADLETYTLRLGTLQHELQQEQHRRLDLEEEINHRGTGHEEEVALRIRFEGRLNQMFAQQRDMETREAQNKLIIQKQQVEIKDSSQQVLDLTAKVKALKETKIALEMQVAELEENLTYVQRVNATLENRLSDSAVKVETLKGDYTQTKEQLQLMQSQLLQRSLIIDKLESEKTAIESQLLKVQAVIDGYQRAKDQALDRVTLLENTMKTEAAKYTGIEQDYVRCKEEEKMKDKMILELKRSVEKLTEELTRTTSQLDTVKVQYDHLTTLCDQQKHQLHLSLSKTEETTRARHLAEDRIDELKTRLTEVTEANSSLQAELLLTKQEVDKVRNELAEAERETEVSEMRKRAAERQFEAQKDGLMQKIKNLSDILNSERKTRETWIDKFEQEQKSNADSLRQAMDSRRLVAETQLQLAAQTSLKEEFSRRLEMEKKAGLEGRKLVLELKSELESVNRKCETFGSLMERLEEEWSKKVQETEQRAAEEHFRLQSKALKQRMFTEDYFAHALRLQSSISALKLACEQQELTTQRHMCRYEDLRTTYFTSVLNVIRYLEQRNAGQVWKFT